MLPCTHATTGKQKHTFLFLGEYGCCITNSTNYYSDTGVLILVAGIFSFFLRSILAYLPDRVHFLLIDALGC